MSTVVAAAPLPPMVDRDSSPKSYPTLAPLSTAPSSNSSPRGHEPSEKNTPTDGKPSPNTSRSGPTSKVAVSIKKEPPASPSLQSGTRHRPRKLDLSITSNAQTNNRGPLTARDGLAMHDVGLACLSPGFQTHDPAMREQLQRSISVRDQQRSIIESRLQKSAKGDGPETGKSTDPNPFGGGPKSSSRKRPPGLSIVPPSASQFANERVIQSAPLNQTFTGRRQPQPLTRHFLNQPPSDYMPSPQINHTPEIHHTPATQTNNRLPPIADVFGADTLAPREGNNNRGGYGQSQNLAPLPSPGLPGGPQSARPREYRSAEEAVHELSGGREDLLPRLVHYSGAQQQQQQHQHQQTSPGRSPPGIHNTNNNNTLSNGLQPPLTAGGNNNTTHLPTPTKPQSQSQSQTLPNPGTSRRRTRNEYEQDNGSPPLGTGPDMRFRNGPAPPAPPTPAAPSGVGAYGPFGAGRDSPDTQRRKKEEFLGLCARAWDLFHS